jgi:hypothetical protein
MTRMHGSAHRMGHEIAAKAKSAFMRQEVTNE